MLTKRRKQKGKKDKKDRQKKEKRNAYNTRYSQAVTHPSTDRARRCLTSVIGREPVFSTWYGRKWSFIYFYSTLYDQKQNKKERKTKKKMKKEKRNAYNTRYSQAVTHPSTDRARRCLTSVIGRSDENRCFQRDMVVGNRWRLTNIHMLLLHILCKLAHTFIIYMWNGL